MTGEVRIGLIGTGFMGKSHAMAYHAVPFIFAAGVRPVLELVADISEEAARAAAEATGFRRATGDWRQLVGDPAIDVVDITTPNVLHKEMALAAIAAGKHVYCEKPLAPTAADALEMTQAAEAAGVKTLVGFNYLKNPAAGMIRGIIDDGAIGDIVHFRGTFDQDALADPRAPFSWRFERAVAGSGALGDLGAHVINLAQYLVGDVEEVSGQIATRITERPVAEGAVGYGDKVAAEAPLRAVENEDEAQFLIRFASGATGTIETSRIASGRKLWLTYEITGTKGAVFFTQERMNEVKLYLADDPAGRQGFRTIPTGPAHPHYASYFPIPGMGLGYNDQKVIEVHELIEAIAKDRPLHPDFRAGWQTCRVVDAVLRSAEERRWVRIEEV